MEKVTGYFDKKDIANRVSEQLPQFTPDQVELILNASFLEISKEIGRGENMVVLDGVGSFFLSPRIARKYRSLQDGEIKESQMHLKIKFKAAKVFADVVKENLKAIIGHLPVK